MENIKEQRRCVTGKLIYSKAEAGRVVNGSKKHNSFSHAYRGSDKPNRYYFCTECGGYHTTHLKQETKKGYLKKPMKTIYGKGYMGEDYEDLVW